MERKPTPTPTLADTIQKEISPSTLEAASLEVTEPGSAPVTVIQPAKGWASLDLKQLWLFRDLFWTFAIRDVKLRYRQTALGAMWVIIQPILAAGVFTFIFGKVARMPSEGMPYFVFSFAGQLGWSVFSGTLAKASGSVVANRGMIAKIYFPRLVLPLSTALGSLLDFAVATVILAVLMLVFQIAPGWQILLAPFWLAILLAMALGIGLLASAMMVRYRDVAHILPVIINLLLYASPVGYSLQAALSRVEPRWHIFFFINPLSGAIDGLRWSFLNTSAPQWQYVAYSAVASVVILYAGLIGFKRLESGFADII